MKLELGDIQGNVLKGYGFPAAAYVSLVVRDARDGRGLLAELRRQVTDATLWAGRPAAALNVALSHEGLRRLGVSKRELASFPHEFRQGMADRADELGDLGRSAPPNWDPGLRQGDIDILVVLHGSSEQVVRGRLRRLTGRVDAYRGVRVSGVQRGRLQWAQDGWQRENFGYRDGFSQPAIRGAPGRQDRGQGVPIAVMDGGWRPVSPASSSSATATRTACSPTRRCRPSRATARSWSTASSRRTCARSGGWSAPWPTSTSTATASFVAAKLAGRWLDGSPLMLHPWIDRGPGPEGGAQRLSLRPRPARPRVPARRPHPPCQPAGRPAGRRPPHPPAPHHPARHPVPRAGAATAA